MKNNGEIGNFTDFSNYFSAGGEEECDLVEENQLFDQMVIDLVNKCTVLSAPAYPPQTAITILQILEELFFHLPDSHVKISAAKIFPVLLKRFFDPEYR